MSPSTIDSCPTRAAFAFGDDVAQSTACCVQLSKAGGLRLGVGFVQMELCASCAQSASPRINSKVSKVRVQGNIS
jgi:hypothetical protein